MLSNIDYSTLPVKLVYLVFPVISIAAKLLGYGMLNYDFFWVFAFAVSFALFIKKHKVGHKTFTFLVCLVSFAFLKYVIPLLIGVTSLKAWAMDFKWIIYLLFVIFWTSVYGLPTKSSILKYSLLFAKIYIVFFAFRLLVLHEDVSRDGILMEANYDGFMMLVGFCFIKDYRHHYKEFLWFLLATLCTMSRTGMATFALIVVFYYARKNLIYLLPIVPILLVGGFYALILRGDSSASNLDRFIYFKQCYLYFATTDLWNVIVGSSPGSPLNMEIIPEFEWTVSNFEEMRSISGVYPFMFHSAYLRLAITWGVPAALMFIIYILKKFFSSNLLESKMFCILTLVQSFSLSTFTIQNLSFLFFITFLVLNKLEQDVTKNRYSQVVSRRRTTYALNRSLS